MFRDLCWKALFFFWLPLSLVGEGGWDGIERFAVISKGDKKDCDSLFGLLDGIALFVHEVAI